MIRRLTRPRTLFVLLLAAYALYAAAFIWRTSAYVPQSSYNPRGERYFVLFDDMMISMRYAKHLAEGHGLVWNVGGERVEGFTNPLWVAWMAFWHALGVLPASKISAAIQVSGALLLWLNLWAVWKLAHRVTGEAWAGVVAVLFSAFYLPLNTWGLQGTEVSVLTLVVTLAALWTLAALEAGCFPWRVYGLLGVATWVRVDMAVPFAMLAAFLIFADRPHRRAHLLTAPSVLAAFLAPQFLLRRWYYGEWLPNTYYLKMTGYPALLRVLHGLEIAVRLLVKTGVWPFGVFLFRRDRRVRLLAWLWGGQMLYSVWVGGDAWEHYGGANRYVAVAMPLLFVLLGATVVAFYRVLARGGVRMAQVGSVVAVLTLLASYNYTYGTGAWEEVLLIRPSLYAGENRNEIEQALLLSALTTPDARIAVTAAGIVPYFAERHYVDLLGKNDPHIACLPMDRQYMPELRPVGLRLLYRGAETGCSARAVDTPARRGDVSGHGLYPDLVSAAARQRLDAARLAACALGADLG